MKKLLSLLLILSLLFLNILFLFACDTSTDDDGDSDYSEGADDDGDGSKEDEDDKSEQPADGKQYDSNGVIIPPYKDYDRGTRDFSVYALDYARPDVDAITAEFERVSRLIRSNEVDFDTQLEAIISLEDGYTTFRSMLTLSEIFNYKDTTNEHWSTEYDYLSSHSADFTQAVEDLFVACAQSPHVSRFEEEYFEEDIEEEYKDGGKYSDYAVELMDEETSLQNEYKSISPATVIITYDDVTDTYENILESLKKRYGEASMMYLLVSGNCQRLYEVEATKLMTDIYVELVKVRYLLAEELGYSGYLEYAYDMMGYEYTPSEFEGLLEDINEYIFPVYSKLYQLLFKPYFDENKTPTRDAASILNSAYNVTAAVDNAFGDIYCYMLQHGLYDVSLASAKRFEASFTTSIEANNSPYLFVTTYGLATDFMTVSHEFGHFIDFYVNGSGASSLELAEVCSQGFEMLSLIMLEQRSNDAIYKYLKYDSMCSFFEVLIYQGLYAAFEHEVYSLSYEEINAQNINNRIANAETKVFGGTTGSIGMYQMLIPHMFIAPVYVQSYCTSIIPAMEIYLKEWDTAGEGLAAYKAIIYREGDGSFIDTLAEAGLTNPFANNLLNTMADEIYYHLTGIHYKKSSNNANVA